MEKSHHLPKNQISSNFLFTFLLEKKNLPAFPLPKRYKRRSGRAEESLSAMWSKSHKRRDLITKLAIQERSKTIAANKKRGSKTVSARRRHKIYTNLFMTFLYTHVGRKRFSLRKRQVSPLFHFSALFLLEPRNSWFAKIILHATHTGLILGVAFWNNYNI